VATTLVSSVGIGASSGAAVTSGAIDTTTATLIVISVAYDCGNQGATGSTPYADNMTAPTDSLANTWVHIRSQQNSEQMESLWYAVSPTVGAAHTFTFTSAGAAKPTLHVLAFNTTNTQLEIHAGGIGGFGDTTCPMNSRTPSKNAALIVTGLDFSFAGTITINGSFTLVNQVNVSGAHVGGAIAYLIQTTAAAVGPTWTSSTTNLMRASMAIFVAPDTPLSPDPLLLGTVVASTDGVTVAATLNTVGASLITVHASYRMQTGQEAAPSIAPTDDLGNTWILAHEEHATIQRHAVYYALPPTASATHTITFTGTSNGVGVSPSMAIGVWQTSWSALDQAVGDSVSTTRFKPGAITPAGVGALVISSINNFNDESSWVTPDMPMTEGLIRKAPFISGRLPSGLGRMPIAAAYNVLDSTDPFDPSWYINIDANAGNVNGVTISFSAGSPTQSVIYHTETKYRRRLRRTPHLSNENLRVFYTKFELDLDRGIGLTTGQGSDPQVMLRWSDDGGHTWSNEHWVSAGKVGEYRKRAIWRRLGQGRDRVFEVTVSDPVAWNLVQAWLDASAGTA